MQSRVLWAHHFCIRPNRRLSTIGIKSYNTLRSADTNLLCRLIRIGVFWWNETLRKSVHCRYYQEIKHNNELQSFTDLREAVAKSRKPIIFESNVTAALQMVAEGNYLYSSNHHLAKWTIYNEVILSSFTQWWRGAIQNICGLTTVPATRERLYRWLGFIFRPDNPFLPQFNKAVIAAQVRRSKSSF